MNVTRFVIIQAISIKGDDDKIELIPFWDGRINYSKSKNEGEFLTLTDRSGSIFDVVECVYDMKNRTVSPGMSGFSWCQHML